MNDGMSRWLGGKIAQNSLKNEIKEKSSISHSLFHGLSSFSV